MTNEFLKEIKHLSIWEIGLRWAGYELSDIALNEPPQRAIDIFRSLLIAHTSGALTLVDLDGYTSETIVEKAIPPSSTITLGYSSSEDSAHPIFYGNWELFVHEMHNDILSRANYSSSYLQSIHVFRDELGNWAVKNTLPFPDFLFSDSEKALIMEGFDNTTGVESSISNKGSMRKSEIDLIWMKLDSGQKARLLAQELALHFWGKDSTLTRTYIIQHDIFIKLFSSYSEETRKNWIKDVDPRPKSERGGRPANK